MKFLHAADLHIGKTVNEFSMQKDQEYVLEQMVLAAKEYKADAFVIAGDVYDRSVPSAEAVEIFDRFLWALVQENIPVLMIAGNHDSGIRLEFARQILEMQGVYIAGTVKQKAESVVIGDTEFVLLPFVRPAEADAANAEQALKNLLQTVPETKGVRHRVLVTHCFATAAGKEPELSDSESTVHVGGIDNVDISVLQGFSYVALGHIHKRQQIGGQNIWYAGAPLAYSFSEDSTQKGIELVTLSEDGSVENRQIRLQPLHAMRSVRGTLEELLEEGERLRVAKSALREDYLRAVLENEEELLNPIYTLRSVYPNVMQIVLAKNERMLEGEIQEAVFGSQRPGIRELFQDFYEQVKGGPMDEKRAAVVDEIIRELM